MNKLSYLVDENYVYKVVSHVQQTKWQYSHD